MRTIILASLTLGLAVLAGSPAHAAVLPVNGTLSIQIGRIGNSPLSFTGSGIGSSSGGMGSSLTIPAALFDATQPVSAAITPVALGLSLIHVPASPAMPVQNPAGAFGPGVFPNGGSLGGVMGLGGNLNLWWASVPVTPSATAFTSCPPAPSTNAACLAGTVPLQYFGGGGTGSGVLAGLPFTVIGGHWSNLGVDATSPTRVVKFTAAASGNPGTVTGTAFDKRTAGGAGTIQLIAPVSIKLMGGNLGRLAAVGVLTLHFVPEPGTLVLVGSGIAGLVAFGRRRASH